jgi:hypothetical protein
MGYVMDGSGIDVLYHIQDQVGSFVQQYDVGTDSKTHIAGR